MSVKWARFHKLRCWNPITGSLIGTVMTLQYLVLDDAFEHIGNGIVVEFRPVPTAGGR